MPDRLVKVAVTDSVNECGCCGKTKLKRTVVLLNQDTGEFVFYGSTCAGHALARSWGSKHPIRTADANRVGKHYVKMNTRTVKSKLDDQGINRKPW
jgi:hypothetical protein